MIPSEIYLTIVKLHFCIINDWKKTDFILATSIQYQIEANG